MVGDGITHPSWRTAGKYTLAATNPVFLDGDGDGQYRSPRDTARQLLAASEPTLEKQWSVVAKADDVIAVQMLSLMSEKGSEDYLTALEERVRHAAAERPLFEEFVRPGAQVIKVKAGQLR